MGHTVKLLHLKLKYYLTKSFTPKNTKIMTGIKKVSNLVKLISIVCLFGYQFSFKSSLKYVLSALNSQ